MKAPAIPDEFHRTFLTERRGWEALRQASVTAGTPSHGTKVRLRTWFLAMFFVAATSRGSRPCSSSAMRAWAETGH